MQYKQYFTHFFFIKKYKSIHFTDGHILSQKEKDTSCDVSFQQIIYYEAKRYLKSDTIRSQIIFS